MWDKFSNGLIETRQDQDFTNEYLEKDKETKHSQLVSCQTRDKIFKMHDIKNIEIILFCSDWTIGYFSKYYPESNPDQISVLQILLGDIVDIVDNNYWHLAKCD